MEATTLLLDVSWMAWTWQTATFFAAIGVSLVAMILITALRPRAPRVGVLGIETTPGDRLFLSLLGSAYICLAVLYFSGPPIGWMLFVCILYSAAVFRWV